MDIGLVRKFFLRPVSHLPQAAQVLGKAIVNIHIAQLSPVSTFGLQTISDILDLTSFCLRALLSSMSDMTTAPLKPSGQMIEVINRQRLIALAMERGYNAFLPVYDDGIDFILCREDGKGGPADIRKVQLKSRWTIHKKYLGRDIWIAFPDRDDWYLAPHDDLVALGDEAGFTASSSWMQKGTYHRAPMSAHLRDAMTDWRI